MASVLCVILGQTTVLSSWLYRNFCVSNKDKYWYKFIVVCAVYEKALKVSGLLNPSR